MPRPKPGRQPGASVAAARCVDRPADESATNHPDAGLPSVLVLTHFVSPYQVELFDTIAETGVDLFVGYCFDAWKGRQWQAGPLRHPHAMLNTAAQRAEIQRRVREADLVVFNVYRHPFVRRQMRARARRGAPWVFWGERPAYRFKGRLGVLYRRWRLAALWHSTAPIWGIGSWAVSKYRDEFGGPRSYANLPYFSDLSRFRRPVGPPREVPRHFLYSGALSARKGVDLLAAAFSKLADEYSDLRLTIVGTGELEADLRRSLRPHGEAIHFAGFQDWQALPDWYHRADALIAPSRYDGWGLIIPEALAAGLPVIAGSQMGAAIDLIEQGRNGWFAEAGSLSALIDTWRSVLDQSAAKFLSQREAAAASVECHQLGDGAARFRMLCRSAVQDWSEQRDPCGEYAQ